MAGLEKLIIFKIYYIYSDNRDFANNIYVQQFSSSGSPTWGAPIKIVETGGGLPTDDNVIQRLSTFNAIYFPDEEHKEIITDDQTLVNTFRIVFNSYFGSDYEMLEDRIYWGLSYKTPFWFKDVTSILLN